MSILEILQEMAESGATEQELQHYVLNDYPREVAEAQADFIERYENDPMVQAGWAQQDAIDAMRYER